MIAGNNRNGDLLSTPLAPSGLALFINELSKEHNALRGERAGEPSLFRRIQEVQDVSMEKR